MVGGSPPCSAPPVRRPSCRSRSSRFRPWFMIAGGVRLVNEEGGQAYEGITSCGARTGPARSDANPHRMRLTVQGICSYSVLMPEYSGRPRPSAWTLSKAHDAGQLVRVRCQHCNIRRYYEPADLQRLIGDVGVDQVAGGMRCENCHKTEWLAATFCHLSGAERAAVHVRRLAKIKMVRRVTWRDE